MSTKKYSPLNLVLLLLVSLFCLSSCGLMQLISLPESKKMKSYYSEKSNYINASGTITALEYSEDGNLLIIYFDEDIAPADTFSSRKFLIEGQNLLAIQTAGFNEKVEIGCFVEFITVPAVLFGYARPIVSLTVNGEVLLGFEDGYQGFLETL